MLGQAALGLVRMMARAGSSSPASRPTGAAGSPRRSSATPRSRRSSASTPTTRRVELERTEFVRVGTQHALLRRIVQAAEIDTVVDTRLVVDSTATSARVAHENNVIGTMNILAACGGPGLAGAQGRLQVLARTTTAASRTTRRSSPRTCSGRTRRARRSSATSSRPRRRSHDFAERNPRRHRHRAALRQRPRARPAHRAHAPALAAGRARDPRLRPALPVHPRGRHRRLPRARRAQRPARASTTRAGDGVLVLSEVAEPARQAARADPAAVGHGLAAAALRRARAPRSRRRCSASCASGAALDNRRLKATGYALRYTTREAVQAFAEHLRLRAAPARRATRPTATSARSRSSCAAARPCASGREPRWAQEAEAARRSLDGLDAAALIALLPSLPRPRARSAGPPRSRKCATSSGLGGHWSSLARSRP